MLMLLAMLEDEEDRLQFIKKYEQCHAKMEEAAIRILLNQHDAEHAVQNAFVQIILRFERTLKIPREELTFWCISIVKNEARMILRKKQKTVPLEDWDSADLSEGESTSYGDLVELITRLPETYRSVLELKFLLGYSDKETAQFLGISETAVSSRASRARALLQEIIRREGYHL